VPDDTIADLNSEVLNDGVKLLEKQLARLERTISLLLWTMTRSPNTDLIIDNYGKRMQGHEIPHTHHVVAGKPWSTVESENRRMSRFQIAIDSVSSLAYPFNAWHVPFDESINNF
jgi:hypothetical protein